MSEWSWCDAGIVEFCILKEMNQYALWPLRGKLEELERYGTEWTFQCLDEATRRTGKIVKLTRVFSVKGFQLRKLNLKLVQWDAQKKAKV